MNDSSPKFAQKFEWVAGSIRIDGKPTAFLWGADVNVRTIAAGIHAVQLELLVEGEVLIHPLFNTNLTYTATPEVLHLTSETGLPTMVTDRMTEAEYEEHRQAYNKIVRLARESDQDGQA